MQTSPWIETPHPALRATFSHKGRREAVINCFAARSRSEIRIPGNTNWHSRRIGVTPGRNKAGKKRNMDGGKADDADVNIRVLIFALVALACGHMLSTLLRTIPA